MAAIARAGRWGALFTRAVSAVATALALLSCTPPAADEAAGHSEPPPRPNILFLFADDQRADTIRAWGNELIDTPNLDRLVAEGWSFRRNYVFGSNSGAVCVPSRAMVLTGRSWMRSPNRMQGVPTLPRLLEAEGYRTFITGKWHNGEEALLRVFDRGTAIYLGGMADHTQTEVQDIENGGMVRRRVGEAFSSELFADAVIEFLDERAGAKASGESEQPFFAYVPFTAPHDPRQPPPEYRERYYERNLPLPANYMPQHPFDNGALILRDENLAAWPRTEEVIRDQVAEYYGLITHLDEQVGRILDALDENGQAGNTIVVYAADHGLSVGSHGLLGKQNLYEHSMRCPLIIRGPGIPHGTTDAFTYLYDLFPTLLTAGGVEKPPGIDGRDLAPLWAGGDPTWRQSVFLPYRDVMRAVRDDRFKLIVYPNVNHRQLFDLAEDPDELLNLIGDPDHAEAATRLEALLEGWQTALGDTVPLSVSDPAPLHRDLTGTEREPDRWQPDWIVEKYFDVPAASEG
ncbi:MAG: sulfatase-like hydrolase/transferase [Holophagales bacterium]|nr:sulfatase-like hydrolase/transferase [Holophagales bacterium]